MVANVKESGVDAPGRVDPEVRIGQAEGTGEGVRKGELTRRSILELAMDIASAEGLEGLTIGRLARALRMSKSGLFAHFGSKTGLQVATVEEAAALFIEEVVSPALAAPPGIRRLWALCDCWLSYVERRVFRGGCFFAAAGAEFDSRPGPVRDLIADKSRQWLAALAEAVRRAQEAGGLDPNIDPEQLAFEVNGYNLSANWMRELLGQERAFARARTALHARLRGLAVSPEARSALDRLQAAGTEASRLTPA